MSNKILYDLVNPSDKYTFLARSGKIASAVAFILGDGMYGVECLRYEPSEEEKPQGMLGFAGEDAIRDHFGCDIIDFLDSNLEEIAESLESVIIGGEGDRHLFFSAMEKISDDDERKKFRDEWIDKKRSSMNNIQERADKWALVLRKKARVEKKSDPPPEAPNQVFVR